jgi:outer membrane protein insertion porin family
VGRFARAFARYSYQIVDVYEIDQSVTIAPTTGVIADDVLAGTGSSLVFDIENIGGAGRRYESAITPTWARDTVDDQFRPRSGTRLTASMQVAGGILGGNLSYLRPSLEAVAYHPVGRRMALGTRAEFGYIRAYGNTEEIPYYQRYFLGGENQIRGYNLRSVAPFDPETEVAIGGDKFILFNAEYYFELPGPLRLLAFFDAGQAYQKGAGLYWKTMSTSTGLELRMVMPVLNVPFRLIYAWNPNRDYYQPPRTFKFAIGTTF